MSAEATRCARLALLAWTFGTPSHSIKAQDWPTNMPVILTVETANSFGYPTRFFDIRNPLVQAGQSLGAIVYADNSFNSNKVRDIEFELEGYPTNQTLFAGASSLKNGYIRNAYGVYATNDFFYQGMIPGNFGSTNIVIGLSAKRYVAASVTEQQLINQIGKRPVAILNFAIYNTNQPGLGTFRFKSTKAFDFAGAEIPSVGLPTSFVNVETYAEIANNAGIILDFSSMLGKMVAKIHVEATDPYWEQNFKLYKYDASFLNRTVLGASEYYPEFGIYGPLDCLDLSNLTNNQPAAFYKAGR